MWRPSDDFRLPSWLCVLIAVAAGAFGIWCGRAGLSGWDNSYGYERYVSFVLLLFAGGSLLVAAIALMFARNRILFWAGLCALFVFFVATTQPKRLKTSGKPSQHSALAAGAAGFAGATHPVSAQSAA